MLNPLPIPRPLWLSGINQSLAQGYRCWVRRIRSVLEQITRHPEIDTTDSLVVRWSGLAPTRDTGPRTVRMAPEPAPSRCDPSGSVSKRARLARGDQLNESYSARSKAAYIANAGGSTKGSVWE